MNNFNNIPNASANSDWKYNFGDGFSCVHVELRNDGCHIQLLKQSVWESIANFFLNLFHQEPIQSHVEDHVITYPENLEIDQNIQSIRDKIFYLEDEGVSPFAIRKELIEQEETARNKALQVSLNHTFKNTLKEPDLPIHQNKSENENASSEHSTEQQEPDASTEQQPSPKQDNPSPHEITLPIESESFDSDEPKSEILADLRILGTSLITDDVKNEVDDNFVEELRDEAVFQEATSQEIEQIPTVTNLTHSENSGETDNRIKKYMKYAGYGMLIVGTIGIGIAASIFRSDWMATFPKGTNNTDALVPLELKDYDNKLLTGNALEGLKLDLNQACESLVATHESLISSNRCIELHVDLALMENTLAADASGSIIEQLAKRVEKTRNDIETLSKTIADNQPATPCLTTPLTALSETIPASPLSEGLFINFISQSFSGKIPQKFSKIQEEFQIGPSTDYLRERLKLMVNSTKKPMAMSLEKSLSSVTPIEIQLGKFSETFIKDFTNYKAELKKIKEEGNSLDLEKGSFYAQEQTRKKMSTLDENVKQLEGQMINSWNTVLSEAKTFLSNQIRHFENDGFFLPSYNGALFQFIPEKTIDNISSSKMWTIKLYPSTTFPDGTYRPFKKIQGIAEEEIFNVEFISDLIFSNKLTSHDLQHLHSLIPTLRSSKISILLEKEEPSAFTNIHDFPIRSYSPLNNLVFVELGPEAYLDFQISTAKHFIDHNVDQLIDNPTLNTLVRNSISSLAYASERAGAHQWIDYPALKEKSRILHEIGNTLRLIDIKAKRQSIAKAPFVDESIGQREIAHGEIPIDGIHPLEKIIDQTKIIPATYIKPLLFTKSSIPLPQPGKLLSVDEIESLVKQFDSSPQISFEEFRAWTARLLSDPAAINSFDLQETGALLDNLAEIAKKLQKSSLESKETGLALVEVAAVADRLLANAGDMPKDSHLPIHQMVDQLQTTGQINENSFHPQLLDQAKNISNSTSHLLFNEILPRRMADISHLSHSKNYKNPYKEYYKGTHNSWDTLQLMYIKDKLRLPLHVKLAVPEWESLSHEKILDAYYNNRETGSLKALREIAESQARFSARTFSTSIENFSKELATLIPERPQIAINAIYLWSKLFNPSTIDRTTLEMLSEEQRIALIDSFGQIAQILLASNFHVGSLLPTPETMITFLNLMTMSDQVMSYSTNIEMARYQLPLERFSSLIKGNNPFFRTFDPHLDTVILESIKNWIIERENFLSNECRILDNPIFSNFVSFFDQPFDYRSFNFGDRRDDKTEEFTLFLMTDPEIGNRLNNDDHHTRDQTKLEKIWKSYVNPDAVFSETGKSLPSWYNSLRIIAHSTFHCMRSGFIRPQGSTLDSTSFVPQVSLKEMRKLSPGNIWFETGYAISHSLKDISLKDYEPYPDISDGITRHHLFSHLEMAFADNGIIKNLRNIFLNIDHPKLVSRPFEDQIYRNIYDLNVAMTKDTTSNRGIYSSDDYRKKWALRGIAPLQISQTISTYLEHPEWLTRIDEQIEFMNLLFDPGLLWHHLQEGGGVGPRAEADLSKFLHTQYLVHDKKPELQAYFAEVGIRLNQYSAAARKSASDLYKDIPVPKELQALANLPKKMLNRKGLPPAERSTYGALHALSYIDQSVLHTKDMISFLQGMFAYHFDEPLKMVNSQHIARQTDNLLEHIQPELKKALYPNGQFDQKILNQILSGAVDTNKITLNPSDTHPLIFSDKENTLTINLQECSIIQIGKEGIFMPVEARFSSAFKTIHGSKSYRAKAIDRLTFQFVDDQGYTNLIQKNVKTDDWNLYRQFEDSSIQFQSVTNSWMQSKPWLKSKTMLSQYTHWHHKGTKGWLENSSPEVRLLDRNGKLAFKVELTGKDGLEIKRIIKIDSEAGELILGDIDQDAYAWARQFEDPGFIHAWISPETRRGQQIEFLRAGNEGLQFSWKNNHWQLDSTPQYHVVKRQIHPLFAQQTNFLLLETDRGERRLLIPRQKLKKTDFNLVDIPFERETMPSATQHIFTLDKNPKTGKFESQDIETNLYLTMLQLGHRNYREAHKLLDVLANNEKGRFSDSEMEILDWIIESSSMPLDETPQSIAIRTFAAHIKSRNVEKNPLNKEMDDYKVPSQLKQDYLKNIQGLSSLRMPPEAEAHLFLHGITAGDLPAVETIAELQISDPENARKAIDALIVQLKDNKNPIVLAELIEPRTFASIPLNAARPDVITPQQFNELIRIDKNTTGFQEIPEQTSAIFDYESDWFKKLSGPTQTFFKNVESGVHQFQKTRDSDNYHLLDADKFNALLKTLETDQRELSIEMLRLRFKILEMANPIPSDIQKAQLLKLQQESGVAKPVTFEMLIDAFIKNDPRYYCSLNPNMSSDLASELDQALQSFIEIVPEWEYRQRLNLAMKTVIEAKEKPLMLQATLKGFVKAKNSVRQFPPEAKRLMKVMEYQTGTYYHKGQVDSLGTLGLPSLETSALSDPGISRVHRITVGAGKTSRLLPSLLQHYAEKGKLALAIMPEAQLTSAGREFSLIMQEVYNKPTLELQITLKDATVENLEAILKKMKIAISQGNPVLTSGKRLRVLRNLFVDNNVQLIKAIARGENDDKLARKALALKQIVSMIKKTKPIIDEVHKEYDPRVETNNPIGMAKELNKEYGVLILNLYEIISQDPDIKQVMHFNFMTEQPLEGAKPFSQDRFQKDVASLIADKFLKKLEDPTTLDPELTSLALFYKELSNEQKLDVKSYVLKTGSLEVINWVGSQTESVRDQLGLIRGQLNVLMPLTLNRNFGERYGYANAKDIMPIPFASADNPNIGSQFSSPFERYNYLIQALMHEGARKPMFEKIVSDLQEDRLKELITIFSEGKNVEIGVRIETEADIEFTRLFKTEEWNLDTPEIAEKLFNKINKDPALFRQLIKSYALPLVKSYPKNLKATSQHLGNQFDNWDGMSGTPGNYPAYPGKFEAPKDEAVIGRMLTLMAEHAIDKTHTVNIRDPKQILMHEACLRANAFMDAGGILAAENLEILADAWGQKIGKAAVRVDRELGIVIKQTPQDKAIPLRSSSIPAKERITLYGQSDIIGTDISHKPNAIGIVSISATTSLSTAEQAAGRMRGIETGQSIEFLVLNDDAIVMRENLGLPSTHVLTSQDVLRHLMLMESNKQMVDTEVALRQKLQAVLDNYVFNWLVESNPEIIAKLPGVDNLLDTLFFPPTAESPFEMFGTEDIVLDKTKAFEREVTKLTGPQSTFARLATPVFGEQTPQIISNLKSSMQAIVNEQLKYINETIVSGPDIDREQEQELLQEQNVQMEQQQAQEVELQQEAIQEPTTLLKKPSLRKSWKLSVESIVSWDTYLPEHQDRLKSLGNTSEGLFSENISISDNFQNGPYQLYPQKPVQNVLIVRNSRTGDYQVAILDPVEVLHFKQVNSRREGIDIPGLFVNPETRKMAAYHYQKNLDFDFDFSLTAFQLDESYKKSLQFLQTKGLRNKSDPAEIWVGHISGRKDFGNDTVFNLQDPKFAGLWLQTRIFAGRLDFSSDQDRKIVKDWLDDWSKTKALTHETTDVKLSIEQREAAKQPAFWLDRVEKMIKEMISAKEDVVAGFHKTDFGKIIAELKTLK